MIQRGTNADDSIDSSSSSRTHARLSLSAAVEIARFAIICCIFPSPKRTLLTVRIAVCARVSCAARADALTPSPSSPRPPPMRGERHRRRVELGHGARQRARRVRQRRRRGGAVGHRRSFGGEDSGRRRDGGGGAVLLVELQQRRLSVGVLALSVKGALHPGFELVLRNRQQRDLARLHERVLQLLLELRCLGVVDHREQLVELLHARLRALEILLVGVRLIGLFEGLLERNLLLRLRDVVEQLRLPRVVPFVLPFEHSP